MTPSLGAVIPAVGDPITAVVRRDGKLCLLLDVVVETYNWEMLGRDSIRFYRYTREGCWWIRGHHDERTEEGRALLAVAALLVTPGGKREKRGVG